MTITIVYLCITALVAGFIVWNMFTDNDLMLQIDAALVIIPLILRLLLVK